MKEKAIVKYLMFLLLILVFVAMPILAGSATPSKALKIGVSAPMTGPGSSWGQGLKKVVSFRVREVNAQGGLLVKGERYELVPIFEDDKYSPAEGRRVAEKLVFQDGVKFVVGPMVSGPCLAAQEVLVPNKILQTTLAINEKAIGPDKPLAFRTWPSPPMLSEALLSWIKRAYPQVQRVGMMSRNDPGGEESLRVLSKLAPRHGLEWLGAELHEADRTDFYPLIARMLPKKPDVLFVGGGTGAVAMQIKQLRERGYKGLLASSTPSETETLLSVAGASALEGHIDVSISLLGAPPPQVRELASKYRAVYNEDVQSDSWNQFDLIDLMVEGIKRADSIDPEKVKEAIEKMTEYNSLMGPAKWGGAAYFGIAHQLMVPVPITQFISGERKLIGLGPCPEPVR